MNRLRHVFLLSFISCFIPWTLMAGEFTVQVVDSEGLSVAGAVVEVSEINQNRIMYSSPTDNNGRTTVTAAIPFTATVQLPGFEPFSRKIDTVSSQAIVLSLVPTVFQVAVEVLVKDTPSMEGPIERSALVIENRGARTVYDAVDKLIPSAHVPSRGILGHGLGISNSISLRGMGGSPTTQLLVVVDGRPDVMGLMGHPIPDFYSLTDVGSLRVTPGPASVLYGNRAMGGVIEVQPAKLKPGFHTELTASLGSYYTGQDRLSHSGELGRFQYRFSGGIGHTNGHRENSAFRDQDGTLRMSYRLTPVWNAAMDGRYGHFTVEDPGTVSETTPGEGARVGRGGYGIGLENRTERAHGSIRFFSSYGHHMLSDGFRSVDSNHGFRLQQTFKIGSAFEVDFGGDAACYGGRARNDFSGHSFGEHHVSEGGGFGLIRWDAVKGIRFNGGFRYDHNSVFGRVVAAEFGVSYRFLEDYALSIAVARGFRNPTIRELFLFPAPTPTLEPERMWNYQASFQFRLIPRLLVWLTGYYSDAHNLIVTTGSYPNLSLENIGRAANRGLEINGRLSLSRRIRFTSGYAWFGSNNPAPYVPANKLTYSLDVDLLRAFITFGASTVGRVRADSAGTVEVDGYTNATLKCTVPIDRYWSVFAMIDNLFNRSYMELAGYPMPGVNASGGFNVRF